jgi:hypothetical protein
MGAEPPQSGEALGPIALQPYASGLTRPVGITHAGDVRLFVVEQGGKIKVLTSGYTHPTPFLDLGVSGLNLIDSSTAEEGLLGLAFHPDYPAVPYFFVHYVNVNSNVVIARYSVSANPNVANPASGVVLLTIPHPGQRNHNGGQLQFGPDGYLYAAVGDGGGGGDPGNNAQNINNLLGKILRIDVDENVGTPPYYGIPPSNPFAGATPGADEIWAYGLRNPWRFSFDRATGDLLIGDVGQGSWEEINFQPAASAGGENYGWRIMEGFNCYINEGVGCFHPTLTDPVLSYGHGLGDCSVTAGFRYRGMSPSYVGEFIYGDFCTGRIWRATPGPTPWPSELLLDSPYFISTFGEDVHGELYLADMFGGTIQRLVLEDQDGDGIGDQVDNCPALANADQLNSDRNFVDQTPPSTQDDGTWINSDNLGDACDDDDDNDGLSDAAEALGCNGSGPLNPVVRDTDGDRFLDGAECLLGTNPADPGSRPTITACGPATDGDGDGIPARVEICHYNSNPNSANTDGDACGDAREVASLNGDNIVNVADMGLLAAEISRPAPPAKISNMDLNKDGAWNPADSGYLASRFGACP